MKESKFINTNKNFHIDREDRIKEIRQADHIREYDHICKYDRLRIEYYGMENLLRIQEYSLKKDHLRMEYSLKEDHLQVVQLRFQLCLGLR